MPLMNMELPMTTMNDDDDDDDDNPNFDYDDGGENAPRERRSSLQVEAAQCAARRPSEATAGRGGQARGRA